MHGTLETLRGTQSDAEKRPSRGEAEQAVRTLIRWAGEHPEGEGLLDTPRRVVRAYEEWFEGYTRIRWRSFRERSRTSAATTRSWPYAIFRSSPAVSTTWQPFKAPCTSATCLEARARRRRLCTAAAGPGEAHGTDRRHNRRGTQPARDGGRRQGHPRLYVDPRRSQARGLDG